MKIDIGAKSSIKYHHELINIRKLNFTTLYTRAHIFTSFKLRYFQNSCFLKSDTTNGIFNCLEDLSKSETFGTSDCQFI